MIDINLVGVFNCTKVVVSYLVKRQYDRIICTWSVFTEILGKQIMPRRKRGLLLYASSGPKSPVPKALSVTPLAPGFIRTDMTDATPESVRQAIIQTISVKRMREPDVASAYSYLTSDEASFMNGQVLDVNGGQAN